MSNTISNALSGTKIESLRLENAAHNIANMNTSGFHATRVAWSGAAGDRVTISPQATALSEGSGEDAAKETSDVDPVRESVSVVTARNSFAADIKVLKAEKDMEQSALDIVA